MALTDMGENIFVQICVVVRDAERTVERYKAIFDFDAQWDLQITHRYDHTQAAYYGKPTNARAKITGFQLGQVAFELLEPLESPSTWMDFLDQHGEGVHHVAFFVPRTAPVAASFVDHGYTITQQGLFTGRSGMYTYLDTDRDLGVVVELLEHYDDIVRTPPPAFPKDRGLGTDTVCQIGLIVGDLDKTAARYREVFGLPEPHRVSAPGYDVAETTYQGQPTEATAELAFFDFGQVQLELIQPDAQPSVWRKHLDHKGNSAHHIAFQVQDTERAVNLFAEHGIGVAQRGLYGDRSGQYTYLDSEDLLGVSIELLENFK